MQILDRVVTRSFICGVELAFNAKAVPSSIAGWQPFYNSTFQDNDFEKAYAGLGSLDFSEESQSTDAGTSYKQKVTFRFPVTDSKRAERLVLLQKIKFVKVVTTSGLRIIVGRNDFRQNRKPVIILKTNEHLCEISIESQSIFPSGYSTGLQYGLPSLIPISF